MATDRDAGLLVNPCGFNTALWVNQRSRSFHTGLIPPLGNRCYYAAVLFT